MKKETENFNFKQLENLHFAPLTSETWMDFEKLLGTKGGCGGCWCMSWRSESRKLFNQQKGAGNKSAMQQRVSAEKPVGIIMYADKQPIGWCSVSPRQDFPALMRSKVWASMDDEPTWSISCVFVSKQYRNQGLLPKMLRAAAEFARQHGAKFLEGYPQDLGEQKLPPPFVWTGLYSAFVKAGFCEAIRRSKTKPIMRCNLLT